MSTAIFTAFLRHSSYTIGGMLVSQPNRHGFKFFFYANEHEPRHIHVIGVNGYAKIELGSFKVIRNNLPPADLRRVLKIGGEYNAEFERKWNEFFSR